MSRSSSAKKEKSVGGAEPIDRTAGVISESLRLTVARGKFQSQLSSFFTFKAPQEHQGNTIMKRKQ